MICNCTEISAKWFWLAYGSIVDGKIYHNLSKHNTIFLKLTLDSPDSKPYAILFQKMTWKLQLKH